MPEGKKRCRVIKLDHTAANAQTFHDAIDRLKQSNPYSKAVDVHEVDEYRDWDLYLSENGRAGFAIKDGDELVSVFSYRGEGAGDSMVQSAVDNGARRLDCYDIHEGLPSLYGRHGFKPIARVKFDRRYADKDWNYQLFDEPDVVAMAVTDNPPKKPSYMEYDDALIEAKKAARHE